jgi:raffinose/stachyose/melibiose transport system permease protein
MARSFTMKSGDTPSFLAARRRHRLPINAGYLFLLPAVICFFGFVVYPIGFVVYTSFFSWSTTANLVFVGWENFTTLRTDAAFLTSMRNTLLWGLITVPAQMLIGGALAFVIEERIPRGRPFFRTIFFLPVVTTVVVIAITWSAMYAPYYGIIGHWMHNLGLATQLDPLGSTSSAIYAIIIINIWEWTGFSMLLYIAGLHNISEEIKEAAQVDGAKGLRLISAIYVPLLAPVHKSLVLLGIIGTLQTFALVFATTGGGPDHASEMPGTYIFKEGFSVQQMGYASSISVVVLVLTLILTALQLRFLGSGNLFQKAQAE